MRRRTVGQDRGENAQSDSKKASCEEPTAVKQQQEKRSCWSTVVLLGKILLLVIFIPPFLNYASLQRERQELGPKGAQLVDIGLGQIISLLCKGHGQPVVILDAPTGMSSDVWYHVQESVSQTTKVCAYDRVGLGFSRRVMENETTGMEKMWRSSTTGRMVDDLHRLVKAAEIATPFVLVGSELGALNARFYSHIHDTQVSDLVLINPIPEDVFEEEKWQQYWYTHLVPTLQMMQLSAAAGVSRLLLIFGLLQPTLTGDDVSEEVIQRQKYLLSNPAHQSGAVDEHFFLNESASQVRDVSRFKPLSSSTSVSVLVGDSFDEQLPAHLNQVFVELQRKALERVYPQAHRIRIGGADRRMIYKKPSPVSKHLLELVSKRQTKQQRQ
ncbi:uncharacterized protein si:dkey-122a22.2 [Hoplias malabaricus]|uniref:uncharacterized protein si:dkey-122a22.2 n=1 Tax=Hoplias malabaricus TaxID=27720 RepID=UPI0034636C1E